MMDACTIDAYTDGGADDYGNPNPTWVSGSEIACGLHMLDVAEVLDASNVPTVDAKLRLPIATSIDPRDRITITKRFGVAITAEKYIIVGQPKRGPSGLVLELKAVVDGS